MLEGQEISIKNLSEVRFDNPTFRYDSEYFKKEYLKIFSTLFKNDCEKMSNLSSWVTQGPNPVFDENGEIPCLTGRNINKGTVNYNNPDFVNSLEYESLKRFQLKKGDTLITLKGKGSIGKIGYVTDGKKAIFSRNIGVIRPKGIDTGFVNAFILSSFGKKILERGETGGTGQSTLTTEYLKNIDIPRFKIEERIGNLVRLSEQVLRNSQETYNQAETLLIETLKLKAFQPSKEPVNIKNFSESFGNSGRLDAEYYQVKYEELIKLLKKNDYSRLCEIAKTRRGTFVPETFYAPIGKRPYLRGADISSNFITTYSTVYIDSYDVKEREKVIDGDVVFSLIGSVGTAALVTKEYEGSVISNNLGVLRITDKSIKPIYLHLYLTNKIVGGLLFAQQEMRTAQPKISDNNIYDFPIPLISIEKQLEIEKLVEESFQLKKQSEHLLEVAKTAVEMAIEQNEETAMKFITNQIS
ncbi:MAG: restriction endonuclease subunit S [Bacteroidales bacterium]|nr:restriction endonuclease subunit S [Bacteroidales bacterium]